MIMASFSPDVGGPEGLGPRPLAKSRLIVAEGRDAELFLVAACRERHCIAAGVGGEDST